jgi:hypothetical protein
MLHAGHGAQAKDLWPGRIVTTGTSTGAGAA